MLINEVISISLAKPKQRNRLVPSAPIADPLKHERVISKLAKQLTRRANLPLVTQDDIRIAKNRAETAQKRVDLEYEKQQKLAQVRQHSHRH